MSSGNTLDDRSGGGLPTDVGERKLRHDLATKWALVHNSARRVSPNTGHHVIVAPHPDDEVLTVGGFIHRLTTAGTRVDVVAVTDGGSAYPEHYEHDRLASRRRREQRAALDILGVGHDCISSLGVRDGQVAANEDDVVTQLARRCTEASTIVAPWSGDVHSDHEAVGRAARRAADQVGCVVWSSLFWAWHRHDLTTLEETNMVRVDLNAANRRFKDAALRCHESQLRPAGIPAMLDSVDLEPSTWPSEYFIVSPPRNSPS